ncbi:MAG: hypothetical protein EOO18_07635 [Chryseobacterium sp.]|nr:MAG: hypothetical protein EOO18_07635 [Chryseobacterium sp.]
MDEVDQFLEFIQKSESHLELGTKELGIVGIDKDLIKIMKASAFLVLYNLIESTMRNSIQEIYEHLKTKNIPFDMVRSELKKVVLKNLKKPKVENILEKIKILSHDVVSAGFDPSDLFSGNVDARLVRDIAEEYGFSSATNSAQTKDGQKLVIVKTQRNDLAHGNKSFSEVGKEKSITEIMIIRDEVKAFLGEIVDNIDKYLTNQLYLSSAE